MSDRVLIPGGQFSMGSDRHYAEERPVRSVDVEPFWIDSAPVTNDEFATFVDATGHVTVAEVAPNADDYPGALPEALVPASVVFVMPPGPVPLDNHYLWWSFVPGAQWRHPTGPDSTIADLGDHPVVHVAWDDVMAYAEWKGGKVPSEAQFEFAARGGLENSEFSWGDEDTQDTEPRANTWQGPFPYRNTEVDGWTRTSPVGSFEPNGYGLYDMIGNVWEWTTDWYVTTQSGERPCCSVDVRSGESESYDPAQPNVHIPRRVIKGGSHLCTTQYCFRYRPSARQPQAVDTGTSHVGFRLVYDSA